MSFDRKLYSLILKVTPPVFLNTVLRGASIFKYTTYSRETKRILIDNDLSGIKVNKSAVICATGPSVSDIDFKKFSNVDFYSVSNFFLHDEIESLSPKIHCFAPYHKPLIKSEFVDWLKASDKHLPKETKILLSIADKYLVDENQLFAERDIIYVALEKAQYGSYCDITKPLMKAQTSPLMLLPVILQMQYDEIYFVGCDHNILKNYGGRVENFYSSSSEIRSNATSGDNWQDGIIKHLKNALNVFNQYRFYFDRYNKVKFYNTSKNSWLDFIEYTSDYSNENNKNSNFEE
jgi:hypothetical protein